MTLNHTHVEAGETVNEIVARHPETIAVFNRFGIDSCCGGGVPLGDAAHRDGAELDALLRALDEVLAQP
jgi:regulator of cell morphogenesis and NO signaling